MEQALQVKSTSILISGGGIGGLACALALAQRGYDVTVCEQANEFKEVGAGLQVAPNALAVLDALGIGGDVKSKSVLIDSLMMMDGISGETVAEVVCDGAFQSRFGNPYAVAHRADLHGSLVSKCENHPRVTLRTNFKVVSFCQDEAGVTITSHGGHTLAGSALIGADGIRSCIRQGVLGDGSPVTAGAVIYRTLIPAEKMPLELRRASATMWAGPGAHLIYYPVSGWGQFNLGITVNQPVANLEEGPVSQDEVVSTFSNWSEIPRRILGLSSSYQRYIIRHREPTERWTSGRVTLLGDAAHPTVQYLAQGAAMALEDALCLATEVANSSGDIASAFDKYQKIRIVRTARVQISSLMIGNLYHASGVGRQVRNSVFENRNQEEYFRRVAWLFDSPDYVKRWRCEVAKKDTFARAPSHAEDATSVASPS